jgi:hypothetical protein
VQSPTSAKRAHGRYNNRHPVLSTCLARRLRSGFRCEGCRPLLLTL